MRGAQHAGAAVGDEPAGETGAADWQVGDQERGGGWLARDGEGGGVRGGVRGWRSWPRGGALWTVEPGGPQVVRARRAARLLILGGGRACLLPWGVG